MATVAEKLLTIEEFAAMPDPGYPTELVRGRIVAMPLPKPLHGVVCAQLVYLVKLFLATNPPGRVMSNDSGVVTERDPDTLRGADVAYYSYRRVPKQTSLSEYLSVAPELIFEVLSPSDRRSNVLRKVAEYLDAGVVLVCVVDPERMQAVLHRADGPTIVLGTDAEFAAPDILPGFSIKVRSFFEE